jgi:hypothetical protein
MTFETIVDDLVALFDVTPTKAVAVVNDRLQDFVTRSTALRAQSTLGTTTSGTASYTLAANIVKVFKVKVDYDAGQINYEGSETLEDMWDLDAGTSEVTDTTTAYWYVVEPDTDALATTDSLRLYPTPSESGATITGLVALRPAVLTYATATALPIPTDVHDALKEGSKAVLYRDEGRDDLATTPDLKYEQGIRDVLSGVQKRGKGMGGHRIRVAGYDYQRG